MAFRHHTTVSTKIIPLLQTHLSLQLLKKPSSLKYLRTVS